MSRFNDALVAQHANAVLGATRDLIRDGMTTAGAEIPLKAISGKADVPVRYVGLVLARDREGLRNVMLNALDDLGRDDREAWSAVVESRDGGSVLVVRPPAGDPAASQDPPVAVTGLEGWRPVLADFDPLGRGFLWE